MPHVLFPHRIGSSVETVVFRLQFLVPVFVQAQTAGSERDRQAAANSCTLGDSHGTPRRFSMQSRTFTQSSILAMVRIAALLFLGILLTSGVLGTVPAASAAGIPWQVGDVVVCYGGGNCNVLRIHGTSVQLLDTLSDGLLGNTGGVALNNSLHVIATDDQGGGSSKVAVYSIASINPFIGTPLSHNVISTFDASNGLSPSAAAIAVN